MNYFKAVNIATTVLASVAESVDKESDEGENISQAEFVRIAVRAIVASMGAFGKELTNCDEDLLDIFRDELQKAGVMASRPGL